MTKEAKGRLGDIFCSVVFLLPSLFLFYAPFHQGSYSYYEGLRSWITISGVLLGAVTFSLHENDKIILGFLIIIILFNPVYPIHLSRSLWAFIDIGSGIFWIYVYINIYRNVKEYREYHKIK